MDVAVSLILLPSACIVSVTHVYGGKLVFLALADKGQGWSPDLLQIHTETFKTLADKVQSAVSLPSSSVPLHCPRQ